MQLPVEAVTATALIEVVRISGLPTGRDDPYPARWLPTGSGAKLSMRWP
ncbi:hypothetical protein [Streptomyces sp. NPDC003483]